MARQSRLFPAWALPPQEYHEALALRLPKAIEAMRHERYRYTADWMLRDEHPQQLEKMLRHPAHFWTRHIRRSKSGKETFVWSPTERLRNLQMSAAIAFLPRAENWKVATTFRPGCSIIENAKPHRNGRSSFRIDIQDAFPSITTNHISAYLVRKGVDKDLAWVLARLWTYRGRLEQGAPVAPTIFNAMLERLDEDLCTTIGAPYARPTPDVRLPTPGFTYTRYGDDMCFSCRDDEFPKELEDVIRGVVESHGFRINAKKTRRGRDGIVDLPGVVIKEGRVRPNGAYRKKLQEGWRFLLPKQIAGHRSYVSSFGHSGDLRVLRTIIGNRTKSRRQLSLEAYWRNRQ